MELKNISSTFSSKTDALLSEIIQKNNLNEDETTLQLTAITMFFSRNEISESQMLDLIQKEIKVSPQTAEQIAKEIKEKLIPTLWNKMPETEKNLLLYGNKVKTEETKKIEKTDTDIFPKVEMPVPKGKNKFTLKKIEKISASGGEKQAPQIKPRTEPDSYREPIE